MIVLVTAANVQDRDGARPALEFLRDLYERIVLVWADGGYAGRLVDWAKERRFDLEHTVRPEGWRLIVLGG
ncbi:transposase [Streptomyces sp. NPDC005708]|uniref:transposase n=1 Tax=Streptomyces sp. NPDC005708 TaxID=3154564 RepID=UPI0033EE6023